METFKFTQLAPHARMNAVTSLRVSVQNLLRLVTVTLEENEALAAQNITPDPEGLNNAIASGFRKKVHLTSRLEALEDDIYCIEYLRNDNQYFTAEGWLIPTSTIERRSPS